MPKREIPKIVDRPLTNNDWKRILEFPWKGKTRKIFELLYRNGNQPTRIADFLEFVPISTLMFTSRINGRFKKHELPYALYILSEDRFKRLWTEMRLQVRVIERESSKTPSAS